MRHRPFRLINVAAGLTGAALVAIGVAHTLPPSENARAVFTEARWRFGWEMAFSLVAVAVGAWAMVGALALVRAVAGPRPSVGGAVLLSMEAQPGDWPPPPIRTEPPAV